MSLKSILKAWVPPIFLQWRKQWRGVRFSGNYQCWEDAVTRDGYDAENILQKVAAATVAVLNGDAAYERDSVLFQEECFNEPFLNGLLFASALHGGNLRVVDFGGALGSAFFQHRRLLSGLNEVRWSVVEQPHYVAAGRKLAMPEELLFYDDFSLALRETVPNVVVFGSVLQYLSDYQSVLDAAIDSDAEFILIDRTPVLSGTFRCRIVRQTVPDVIYRANYPARFIGELQLLQQFEPKFRLLHRYRNAGSIQLKNENTPIYYEGFLFQRIKEAKG